MFGKLYEGNDRVAQVNWLKQEADSIANYGEGTGEELVSFWEDQCEKPDWFDAHDRNLLVEMVDKAVNS